MKKQPTKKNSYTLRDRFRYWFDNHMAKGSLGFIRFLIVASLVLAVLIAGLIILFHFNEEGETTSVFWNSIATVLNAWMPSYEEGSIGYLILMSVSAIAGVLFTSVLIGIITSAIEEKIVDLKKGNSLVLERDHIVVLGFTPGDCTLLNQLILAADGAPCRIVLAEDMEREEMEQSLEENLEIPKNVRIICRTADITSPQSIEKCAVEAARMVIVNPGEDLKVAKAVLAVNALMEEKNITDVRVSAILTGNQFRLPDSLAGAHRIAILRTNDVMAKMIAHACTEIGLSETFLETFNFEGSEFYLAELPEGAGDTFETVAVRLNHGVAAGYERDGKVYLNPPKGDAILKGDRILVFAEHGSGISLESEALAGETPPAAFLHEEEPTEVIVVGHNESLSVILREMPENVTEVTLVDPEVTGEEKETLESVAGERNLRIKYLDRNPRDERVMLEIAKQAKHLVILSDHEKDAEEADMETVFLLLHFRELREIYNLPFNITVELQKEQNQRLAGAGDRTDFLVTSSMSSLLLAQLAENPELVGVFHEILSNEGNELYLKNVGTAGLTGTHPVRALRRAAIEGGYVLLGYVAPDKRSTFLLDPAEEVSLTPEEDLIVIGRG